MEKKINRGVIRTGETDIKVHLIDSFPNHPYHVFDDEDMTELAASIEANGLLNPIIVRSKADGRYELISGHRRKRAYEILKINKIRAIIVDVTDDEAIIMMVDSNCQRSKILPSEKAFSYKMKLDAIKRQGKRNDLTSTQVVSKLRSNEELGKEVNESRETIRRFIRLTNLIPELLDFVDKGRMKMQPAVELSYLDEESQRDLVDIIDGTEVFPSFSQTVRMRKAFKDGELTYELVEKIMAEDKLDERFGNEVEMRRGYVSHKWSRATWYIGEYTTPSGSNQQKIQLGLSAMDSQTGHSGAVLQPCLFSGRKNRGMLFDDAWYSKHMALSEDGINEALDTVYMTLNDNAQKLVDTIGIVINHPALYAQKLCSELNKLAKQTSTVALPAKTIKSFISTVSGLEAIRSSVTVWDIIEILWDIPETTGASEAHKDGLMKTVSRVLAINHSALDKA